VADYLEALTQDPHHLESAMNLVEMAPLIGSGLVAEAQSRLHVLQGDHPHEAVLRYASGRLALEQGNFATALRQLESAVRCDPHLGVGWYTLSMLCSMMGEFAASASAADRALRYFPDDTSLWLNRAQAMQEQKLYAEAMASYDQAINLAPYDSLPWLQLGRLLLLDLDRVADARGALREAHRLSPDDDNIIWLLALCALRLGREDEAATEIAKLLSKDPSHLWGRLLRAMLNAQQQDPDAAFADLAVVVSLGYDVSVLSAEPLFAQLKSDARFAGMFAKKRASASQKSF
jgi:tetratricopeptide (TPR) repeat protein